MHPGSHPVAVVPGSRPVQGALSAGERPQQPADQPAAAGCSSNPGQEWLPAQGAPSMPVLSQTTQQQEQPAEEAPPPWGQSPRALLRAGRSSATGSSGGGQSPAEREQLLLRAVDDVEVTHALLVLLLTGEAQVTVG